MILIDNMEMPKNCKECRFMYQDTGELNNGEEVKVYMCSARSQGTAEKDYADKRSEWCPLHEVTADPDTISRRQAIDTLFGILDRPNHADFLYTDEIARALNQLPPSPSIKPDPDTVSRQQALEHIKKRLYESALNNDGIVSETFEEIADNRIQIWIDELPPLPTPSRQAESQWIPCSKELPERNRVVLVTTKWGEVTEGVKLSGDAWFIGRGEDNAYDSDILAWKEKPQPYKAK